MSRSIPAEELDRIEKLVRDRPGITSAQVVDVLGEQVPRRTLQFRLKRLVQEGRVLREGEARWARYRSPEATPSATQLEPPTDDAAIPLSRESQEIRAYLRQPLAARKPVGYKREFLSAYRPGVTFYLPEDARAPRPNRRETGGRAGTGRDLRPADPEPTSDRSVVEFESSRREHVLRHRDALRAVVTEVVLGRMDRKTAVAHIGSWATAHLDDSDRAAFREVAETELRGLHEGIFARYTIRPGEFAAWQAVWGQRGQ